MARVVLDFNQLPLATRERLIDGMNPMPLQAPIFSATTSTAGPVAGAGLLGLGALFFLYNLITRGFGEPELFPYAVQNGWDLLAYVIACFFLAAAALVIAFHVRQRKALPFTPGRYLFPLDYIDARSKQLVIRSLSDLIDLNAVHHHSNGLYTHTSFTFLFQGGDSEEFTIRNQRDAETQMRQLQRIRAEFGKALEQQDLETIKRHDLFFDVRVRGGFEALQKNPSPSTEGGVFAGGMPRLLELRWVAALVLAVGLGGVTWLTRNLLSDHYTFAAAKERKEERPFRYYLETGWLHVAEAKELGAQYGFANCESQGTEGCWKTFLEHWSESPRLQEVREQRLPRAALKEASSKGTVSALRQFRKNYPQSVVDADAKELIHQLFAKALADFEQEASTKNRALIPFVSKLLAHLEATENPTVLMRFRREVSGSLAKADKLLAKAGAEEGRTMAEVSPHFADARTLPLENTITEKLGVAFELIFPSDLLTLEKGAALSKEQGSTPETVPSLDIVYTVGWSGESYSSRRDGDRRLFVGIEFDFAASMRVPGEKPLQFSLTVKPPDQFAVDYQRYGGLSGLVGPDGGPTEEAVYRIMALRAFDELHDKTRQVFFRPDSKVFKDREVSGTAFDTVP
jgi:hypothetical protein